MTDPSVSPETAVRRIRAAWRAHVPHSAKLTLLAFVNHADEHGTVLAHNEDLAGFIGCSSRLIRKNALKLVDRGLLEIVYCGGGRSRPNVYRVLV